MPVTAVFWILAFLLAVVIFGINIMLALGLSKILSKRRFPSKNRIFLTFILFGAITGIIVSLFPLTGYFLGFPAGIFTPIIYVWLSGDPNFYLIHGTDWSLGSHPLYIAVSVVTWVLVGLIAQAIYDNKSKISRFFRSHKLQLRAFHAKP